MVDTLSRFERSARMALVRAKDTKPELSIRRAVFKNGYRYQLHDKKMPGKPDMVFTRRKVIFINGCFWHRHEECSLARIPKSNRDFWINKLSANKARDEENWKKLRECGWSVLVIWECELRNIHSLLIKVKNFLGPPSLSKNSPR
ncbi:very short patch repair endonuclease [Achromobacter kerstersii]|uniref:very short patch repair endonuclease n=1 Tax=Achromobacter kerstersii TaxID=1353890 RepID=UPI003CFD2CD6